MKFETIAYWIKALYRLRHAPHVCPLLGERRDYLRFWIRLAREYKSGK